MTSVEAAASAAPPSGKKALRIPCSCARRSTARASTAAASRKPEALRTLIDRVRSALGPESLGRRDRTRPARRRERPDRPFARPARAEPTRVAAGASARRARSRGRAPCRNAARRAVPKSPAARPTARRSSSCGARVSLRAGSRRSRAGCAGSWRSAANRPPPESTTSARAIAARTARQSQRGVASILYASDVIFGVADSTSRHDAGKRRRICVDDDVEQRLVAEISEAVIAREQHARHHRAVGWKRR